MSNVNQQLTGKKKNKRAQNNSLWQKINEKNILESQLKEQVNKIRQQKTLKPNTGRNSPIFKDLPTSSNTPNPPNISGKPIPVKTNQPSQKKKAGLPNESSKKIETATQIFVPNTNPHGPKFIPLAEAEKSNITVKIGGNINKGTKEASKVNPSQPTERNFKTLIGDSTNNELNQQKKILKFQMKFQQLQEKQKHAKNESPIITSNTATEDTMMVNTMQATDTSSKPVGVPAPMPALMDLDFVVTAFSNDHFIVEPEKKQTMPFPNVAPKKQVDSFGTYYPKGIPKSFLKNQQQHTATIQSTQPSNVVFQPSYIDVPMISNSQASELNVTSPLTVQTDGQEDIAQPYSPSELYNDIERPASRDNEDYESSEHNQSGQKRLSAFRRLGPQTQPKKPKLTISVTVNEDQEVREVVDETDEVEVAEVTPVHLREDIMLSTDETVMKYLKSWPWKRNVAVRKSVTARTSMTVMILETEQMDEIYEKESVFIHVSIKGYPPSWTKEQVLDMLMENMRGYSFIPCFIEFNREECKFLTLRCRSALLCLHKCGFIIRKDDVELIITLGQTDLTLRHLDFVPRLVLRRRVHMCMKENNILDLTAFTLKDDISHFIYFPLNRVFNQTEIVQLQTEVSWAFLTELNLSRNRIFSLEGFELDQATPKLKHLNLSHNCIEKITSLLNCRNLPLKSIHLEGNPLCTDYTDPKQYIKVIKMLFPSVTIIDNIPIQLKGDMPKFIRNYCPEEAKELVGKFLEIYFPLIDGDIEHRAMLKEMYEDNAVMTITYHYKLAFGPIHRCYKSLFQNSRQLEEGNLTMIKGSAAIIKSIANWPPTEHDPFTFTVDVLYHSGSTIILRIDGILKLARESLAEDEHLLMFSRTFVLYTRDYVEYKIQNEMLYWNIPSESYAKSSFIRTTRTKLENPKIDTTTDEKLQGELLKIFMTLTTMDKKICERCLELKKWNLKEALDYFSKLLKLDSLETLIKDVS